MLWIQYIKRLGGRPKSGFDESSTRTKKCRSEKLSTEKTLNELFRAAIVLLKKFGRVEDAKIVSKILSQSEDGSCSIKSTSKYSPSACVEIGNHCLQKNNYSQHIITIILKLNSQNLNESGNFLDVTGLL